MRVQALLVLILESSSLAPQFELDHHHSNSASSQSQSASFSLHGLGTVVERVYFRSAHVRSSASSQSVGTAATAAGVVATVGLSRVLLGAHWLTDVMTGWVSGA